MISKFFDCVVLVSVVNYRSVVARENHQGVSRQLQPFHGIQDFADAPIELQNHISSGAHPAFTCEPCVRHARDMDVVRGVIQEKLFLPMLLQKLDRLLRDDICHVFIHPTRAFASGHVSDPTDSIDNRLVVPVAEMHF